jgi:uncharacterized protein
MTTALAKEFREGLTAGQLLVQKCEKCLRLNMYPRYACPFCQSRNLTWQKVSGKGRLDSFTVLRMGAPEGFETDLPYALAVVKLGEGVQLLARLIPDADGDWSQYACDQKLQFASTGPGQAICAWFKRAESA